MRRMSVRSRRRLARVIVLAMAMVVAAVVSACGGSGSSSNGGGGGATTVTVWSWRDQDAGLWRQVQKDLQANGDNIHINFQPKIVNEYDSTLQTAMTAGDGPDLMFVDQGATLLKYAQSQLIAPLSGVVNTSKVSTVALNTAKYQGKVYGVPYAVQTLHVFYNKAIFKKYHLHTPKTWDDFIALCKALKADGVTPIDAMGTQPRVLTHTIDEIAASTVSPQWTTRVTDKQIGYDTGPYIESLQKFQSLVPFFEQNWQASGDPTGASQWQALALGKAAMIFDGIYAVQGILKYNKNLQLGEFVVPPETASEVSALPGGAADYTTTPHVDWYVDGYIALNSHIGNSAEAAAARKVAQFTTTKQFGELYTGVAGELSTTAGVEPPSKFPVAISADAEYKSEAVHPPFDLPSPMNVPPLTNNGAPAADLGYFAATEAIAQPVSTSQMSADAGAAALQKSLAWYFKK